QSLQAAVEQYGVHAIGAGIACVVARQLDQAKRLPRADMDFPHDPKALAELDTSSGEASIEGGDIELPDALRAQLGQRSVRRPWRRTGSQCRGDVADPGSRIVTVIAIGRAAQARRQGT